MGPNSKERMELEDPDATLKLDSSIVSEHNFITNNANVTVINAMNKVEDLDVSGRDGSDSGVEVNGGNEPTPAETPEAASSEPLVKTPDYDGTSEGGSESSSTVFVQTPRSRRQGLSTRKTSNVSSKVDCGQRCKIASTSCQRSRSIAATPTACDREQSLPRCATSARGRAKANSNSSDASSSKSGANGSKAAWNSSKSQPDGPTTPRGRPLTRTPSVPRPSALTVNNDGRWPSTSSRPMTLSRTRGNDSRRDTLSSSGSKNSINSSQNGQTPSTPSPTVESREKFATLPKRRRRRSAEGLPVNNRTNSTQPARRNIILYHETGVQTSLSCQDVEDALQGSGCRLRPIDAVDTMDQEVQADCLRDDWELLERKLAAVLVLAGEDVHSASVSDSKLDKPVWMDHLSRLERQIQNRQELEEQLQSQNLRLKRDLEKSEELRYAMQRQREETEEEVAELHEFLQVEKAALTDSLREAEIELQEERHNYKQLQEKLERQREECQHLVRISEQRRQEVLTLEARVAATEDRWRELLLQQGAMVSGASVGLSALMTRLEELASNLESANEETVLGALETALQTHGSCKKAVESLPVPSISDMLENEQEPVLDDTPRLVNSESLQNLSAAILTRQQQEEGAGESGQELPNALPLVDQVVDVDMLLTTVIKAMQSATDKLRVKEPVSTDASPLSTSSSSYSTAA